MGRRGGAAQEWGPDRGRDVDAILRGGGSVPSGLGRHPTWADPTARPPRNWIQSPATARWLMVPPILLTTYAYAPILRNYFIADDFIYLYRVRNAPFDEFFL